MTTFNGTLDITVHDAELTLSQHLSKQDPYCIVTLGTSGLKNLLEGETLGKEKFETKAHNGAGKHPVWNETHSLSLKNMTFASHLKVKVYDKDPGKDDFLGVARANLDELLPFDNKGVQYLPLFKEDTTDKDRTTIGRVGVSVKFNCTEIPQGHSDLKTQAQEALARHDQEPLGVHGAYQQGHGAHLSGPQQSVPSTYQGPVQSIHPGDDTQTHHKHGLGTALGTGVALGTGAALAATAGTGTHHGVTPHGTTTTGVTHPTQGTQPTGTQPLTTFNGTLEVTIADAKTTVGQHLSKQDPYCVVVLGSGGIKNILEGAHLGPEKFKTKVHSGAGQNPVWNETHSLSLKNMTLASHLEVRVYDKDFLKDDYLGLASITLGDLLRIDRKGVQYLPIHKKPTLGHSKTDQIGEVGVGVVFNSTEIPQGHADLKDQYTEALIRKDQQLSGVSGHHQSAQPDVTHPVVGTGPMPMGPTTTGTTGLTGHSTGTTGLTGHTGVGHTTGTTGYPTGTTGLTGTTGVGHTTGTTGYPTGTTGLTGTTGVPGHTTGTTGVPGHTTETTGITGPTGTTGVHTGLTGTTGVPGHTTGTTGVHTGVPGHTTGTTGVHTGVQGTTGTTGVHTGVQGTTGTTGTTGAPGYTTGTGVTH